MSKEWCVECHQTWPTHLLTCRTGSLLQEARDDKGCLVCRVLEER
jgi:hypothetical protein